MESRFTKGNWTIQYKSHGNRAMIITDTEIIIADLWDMGAGFATPLEAQSNAKLIAAAPDLYESLEELLGSLNSYDENDQDAINKAKNALEKAKKG